MNPAAVYFSFSRSFLALTACRLALFLIPVALLTAAPAGPGFNPPNTTNITTSGCTTSSTGGTLAGSVTGGRTGVTLSAANVTFTGSSDATGSCNLVLQWKGTGSGTFNGSTGTVAAQFNTGVNFGDEEPLNSYTLTVYINGSQQYTNTVTCAEAQGNGNTITGGGCVRWPDETAGGATTFISSLAFPLGATTLSTWEVDLTFNAHNLEVTVSPDTSVDVAAAFQSVSPVPAPSTGSLAAIALLAGLAGYQTLARKRDGAGLSKPPM